jgi:predicted O-methyltransferase YrrM
MKKVDWTTDTEFTFEGINFLCPTRDVHYYKTNADKVILIKDKETIASYCEVLDGIDIKNALEFGFLQGGSPIFFSMLLDLRRFVGIDISAPVLGLDSLLKTLPVGERIKLFYQISQTDKASIIDIVKKEFCDQALDMIIDDASHQYNLTKCTFEIAFPLLKPGGVYVIEDWGWAHWPTYKQSLKTRMSRAMSNLVLELVMSCATSPHIIHKVIVYRAFAFIIKSKDAPHVENLRLKDLYITRNRKFWKI